MTLNSQLTVKTTYLYVGEEIERNEYGMITNKGVSNTGDYFPVEGSTNSFTFELGSAAFDEGKYVLYIPAGVFLMGEEPTNYNDVITVVYACNGEGLDQLEVNPSVPVKELSEFTIEYVNETSISFQNPTFHGFSLYKYVEGQSYGTYIDYINDESMKITGNRLHVILKEPITEAGEYYIEISQYFLYMSDGETKSTPQKVFFTVDPDAEPVSVDTVGADLKDSRIFNINGVEVKDMSKPGLYIVNGKKILVR